MRTFIRIIFLPVFFCMVALSVSAQSAAPSGIFLRVDGEETTDATQAQDAPLVAHFFANPDPEDLDGYTARWEWKIWKADKPGELLVHRFDEDIEYTFTESGTFKVQLYATFTLEGDTISWPEEGEEDPIIVVISESKLEMPNAFSPNGDGINDIYNAKSGYQSIVSFEATIFNRWGQKIYSWNNPDRNVAGWDGKWHGQTVHDGVYFVVVNAKGADGHHYKIRKDVNVLTGSNRDKEQQGYDE